MNALSPDQSSIVPDLAPRPPLRRAWTLLRLAADAVSAAIFATMFVLMVAGVVARYGFGNPVAWIDEVVTVLFLWLIFWTASFVTREREEVSFDLLHNALPERARRWTALGASAAVGLLFLAALPTVVDYTAFLWRERTSVMQWRLDQVYACFALFLGVAALRLLTRAGRLAGRSWRDHVA